MEPQTTTCALCGEQSLPAGQRRPSCECTPDGRIRLDSIDSYVRCRNQKCGKKISKACYRLIRKAAMEAFPEFTDDPVEFERILDDELGIWRAIFDDVVDSSEFHAKHSAVYSPAANGKAASFQNCILCEDYKVRPGTRVLDDMFKNADADLDPPFSFFVPANLPCPDGRQTMVLVETEFQGCWPLVDETTCESFFKGFKATLDSYGRARPCSNPPNPLACLASLSHPSFFLQPFSLLQHTQHRGPSRRGFGLARCRQSYPSTHRTFCFLSALALLLSMLAMSRAPLPRVILSQR